MGPREHFSGVSHLVQHRGSKCQDVKGLLHSLSALSFLEWIHLVSLSQHMSLCSSAFKVLATLYFHILPQFIKIQS